MVATETQLPATFERGRRHGGKVDLSTTENVRWVSKLGTNAYGNPTVAHGRVFVGTDAKAVVDDPRFDPPPAGVVVCLNESNGKMLWRLAVPERTYGLPDSNHFVMQRCGICSSPTVVGNRVYLVTSADEVVCLDVHGLADGNDGPFQDEAQYMAGRGRPPIKLNAHDADIIWRFDLIDQLGVCPHDAASCSVLIEGDVLYTSTSNGVGGDKGSHWTKMHAYVVKPKAPAFVALDKNTGRLLAVDGAGISTRLWHAQWSSPSLGVVNGKKLVFLGGGDGYCYAFEALSHMPSKPTKLKLVWKYDCNPPEYRCPNGVPVGYYRGDKRQNPANKNDGKYVGPSQVIATPVFYHNRVYIGIGQDPAHGRGRGMFHCIDATQQGDVTKTACVWRYDGIERSLSTAAIQDGLVYIPDLAGKIHCLDAETGHVYWVYETKGQTWGSTLVADGKLFFGNQRYFFVFAAGRKPQLLSKIRLGAPIYSSPIAANGVVYVSTGRELWAIGHKRN